MRITRQLLPLAALLPIFSLATEASAEPDTAALQALGKRVFFDPISDPTAGEQSCSSCHTAGSGWVGGSSAIHRGRVGMPGSVPGRFGGRKPPSIAYAGDTPNFECVNGRFGLACTGGVFWDGRATGTAVGNEVFGGAADLQAEYGQFLGPLTDQALGPFANPVEQNVPTDVAGDGGIPGARFVCQHVAYSEYAYLYSRAWGETPRCNTGAQAALSFKRIAMAIAAWEMGPEVNSFSSKRDDALATDADGLFPLDGLTDQENLGHDLFYGITSALNPGGTDANCSACHNNKGPGSVGEEPDQTYTDSGFRNLGIPPNHQIAGFDPNAPDRGLGARVAGEDGLFRTPTLRNVGKKPHRRFVKSYMHNGYLKTLEDVVHFYNTARAPEKVDPILCPPGTTARMARLRDCWPAPEIAANRPPPFLVGNLGLTAAEEAAIVAYMRTLSDTEVFVPPVAE